MPFARPPRVAALVVALLTSLALPAHAVTIDWVPVGDPIKQHLFCKSRVSEVGHLASMFR